LPLPSPGLETLRTLNLADTLAKVRDYFNVAAGSFPDAATISAVNSVLSSQLPARSVHLFAPIDESTTPTRRTELLHALRQISVDLSQNIVPSGVAEPPTLAQLRGFQTALITWLDTNRLQGLRAFLTAAANQITNSNAMRYYIVQIGVPVVIYQYEAETVSGGSMSLVHSGVIVLNSQERDIYRNFNAAQWTGDLPASAPFRTANPNTDTNRAVAVLVPSHNDGRLQFAFAPMVYVPSQDVDPNDPLGLNGLSSSTTSFTYMDHIKSWSQP
jgi:hypothetical protein